MKSTPARHKTPATTGVASPREACPVRQINLSQIGVELNAYLRQGYEIETAADGWVQLGKHHRHLVLHTPTP